MSSEYKEIQNSSFRKVQLKINGVAGNETSNLGSASLD